MKKYLLVATYFYSLPILRPIQKVIRARGGEVAWFFDGDCARYLRDDEIQLKSVKEVMDYNPIAVICADDVVYDFFPGIKVMVFHGCTIAKRGNNKTHFTIRGCFDLYCTHGSTSTPMFEKLAHKYRTFAVKETGWPKIDNFFSDETHVAGDNKTPTILYCSTFTKWITSTPYLYEDIEKLIVAKDWNWIITFHPMMDAQTVERYKALRKYDNVTFYEGDDNVDILCRADVMVCDSSSIMVEFMSMDKPVVTFKNTVGGDFLIDIDDPALLGESIEKAMKYPPELMSNIHSYVDSMNPYRDGKSSERIIDAIDNFIESGTAKTLKRKPLNLLRRYKMRKKLNYFPFMKTFNTLLCK